MPTSSAAAIPVQSAKLMALLPHIKTCDTSRPWLDSWLCTIQQALWLRCRDISYLAAHLIDAYPRSLDVAATLLPRAVDLEYVIRELAFSPKGVRWPLVRAMGMPAERYHEANLSGRYCLDLGVVGDRVVAYLLLLHGRQARKETSRRRRMKVELIDSRPVFTCTANVVYIPVERADDEASGNVAGMSREVGRYFAWLFDPWNCSVTCDEPSVHLPTSGYLLLSFIWPPDFLSEP